MTIPMQISFKGIDHSDALTAHITAVAGKLEQVYDRIERCEVVVEAPHRHSPRTPQFHVRVRLHVPGNDVIVDRDADAGGDQPHDDPYIAVRDAFQAARRRLTAHVQRLRGDVRPRAH
jgi:ribosome-associated translation inhibitor RaiA